MLLLNSQIKCRHTVQTVKCGYLFLFEVYVDTVTATYIFCHCGLFRLTQIQHCTSQVIHLKTSTSVHRFPPQKRSFLFHKISQDHHDLTIIVQCIALTRSNKSQPVSFSIYLISGSGDDISVAGILKNSDSHTYTNNTLTT